MTPEQKKCIDDAVKKANEDSPDAVKWLNEVESMKKTYRDNAEKCRELENELEQE